ncbi:hypothetical protein OL548_16690 [Lysinibacillus sp. MHQ-1]|nr:hypothetical protein OL548_16690 [Lysinibacillus sp. MHQ-1]
MLNQDRLLKCKKYLLIVGIIIPSGTISMGGTIGPLVAFYTGPNKLLLIATITASIVYSTMFRVDHVLSHSILVKLTFAPQFVYYKI